MESRALGSTGLSVSALGYGCGDIGGLMTKGDPTEQRAAVERALTAGITYFDTAPGYGNGASERNLGRVLGELGAWNRVRVGTKVRLTRDQLADVPGAVHASVTASLKRLNHDSVDLLQLHTPIANPPSDSQLAPEEVLNEVASAFETIRNEGLARHIGITGLGATAGIRQVILSRRFETVQAYFNAVNPSAGYAGYRGGEQDMSGLIADATAAGMGVINIRVMAAGTLQASRHANAGDPGYAIIEGHDIGGHLSRGERLAALAAELGLAGPYELSFRLALATPGISTILIGFSSLAQLHAAIDYVNSGPLPAAAVSQVLRLADAA
ncbi:MAG: aldo/keto reductase [Chloroflexota bacterium]